MTKVEAIQKVMEDNHGTANLEIIYDNIESNERFKFINYDEIIELYENASRVNRIENKIF